MEIVKNKNIQDYTTFNLPAIAKQFTTFTSIEELIALLRNNKNTPIKILGGGSNILVTQYVDALVLKNEIKGMELTSQDSKYYYIKCAAGENWHQFVLWCIEKNYQGIENLSLIPGTTGAAPMQNIGAYGVEIQDVFYELTAVDVETKSIKVFNKKQCKFGYRESVFKKELKDQYVIIDVTFKLNKEPNYNTSYGDIEKILVAKNIATPTAKDISTAVIEIRNSKLPNPKEIGNAGSFFKNPVITHTKYANLYLKYSKMPGFVNSDDSVKVPAAWLIEQCGFKGKRIDDVGVHAKQALVLVNYGNGNGQQLLELSENIMDAVQRKFNILLEREVNIW